MPGAWMIFDDGKWREGGDEAFANGTRFRDVWRFRANVIDYARVLMCVLAAVAVAVDVPIPAAILILGSVLLDWVDGPVARARDECTIFGSGVDWLADILAQIVTLVWVATLAPAWAPLLLVATGIELANALFDFAITATARYPLLQRQGGFGWILDRFMPGGSYTRAGTALWVAYPVFVLACCLDLSDAWTGWSVRAVQVTTAVPAVLYVWCELAYLCFVLRRWREPARGTAAARYDDGPAGFRHLGRLPHSEEGLLRGAWTESVAEVRDAWRASMERGAVFWVNIWQRQEPDAYLPIACIDELDRWAHGLLTRHYDAAEVELDGYGLIANPIGSGPQKWHIDYTVDYSTIFVPLTDLTPDNTLQYVVLPPTVPREAFAAATADLDDVDLAALVGASDWVSIRQFLTTPFSIVKMDFGTIHRAVANTGDYDRVLFWVSFQKRGPLLPPEPLLGTIEDRDATAATDQAAPA